MSCATRWFKRSWPLTTASRSSRAPCRRRAAEAGGDDMSPTAPARRNHNVRDLRLVAVVAVVALAAILLTELPFTSASVRAGQRAPETFRVPADRTVTDDVATERARRQAADEVGQQYKTDQTAN